MRLYQNKCVYVCMYVCIKNKGSSTLQHVSESSFFSKLHDAPLCISHFVYNVWMVSWVTSTLGLSGMTHAFTTYLYTSIHKQSKEHGPGPHRRLCLWAIKNVLCKMTSSFTWVMGTGSRPALHRWKSCWKIPAHFSYHPEEWTRAAKQIVVKETNGGRSNCHTLTHRVI